MTTTTNDDVASSNDIVEQEDIPTLVNRFSNNTDDVEVLLQAGQQLMSRVRDENTSTAAVLHEIVQAGGIINTIKAMQHFIKSEPVQGIGFFLLDSLAYNGTNKQAIVTSGGIPVVISAMENCLDEAPLVAFGLQQILFKFIKSHTEVIIDSGGILVVIKAMKCHPDHYDIQKASIGILGCVSQIEACGNAMVREGAIPAIIDALKLSCTIEEDVVHVGGMYTCVVGFSSLQILISIGTEDEAAGAIMEAGGIEAIIAAMKHRHQSAALQTQGCSVMLALTINEDTRLVVCNAIVEAGGIPTLTEAANIILNKQGHCPTEDSLCTLVSVLTDIASSSNDNAISIRENGIVPVLITSLKRYNNIKLQANILQMLSSLMTRLVDFASVPTATSNIFDCGGHEVIIAVMERNVSSVLIQKAGCKLLWYLSSNNGGRPELVVAAGGIQVLEAARAQYRNNSYIQDWSNLPLDHLKSIPHCYKCNKTSTTLMTCSRCKIAKYCTKMCQRDHWKVHRIQCKEVSSGGK